MASLVAKNYAQALFEIAQDEQRLDEYRQSLADIQYLLTENKQLMDIIKHNINLTLNQELVLVILL